MAQEKLSFNGVNGATGKYLPGPKTMDELGDLALGWKMAEARLNELSFRSKGAGGAAFAINPDRDPRDLSQAGWGIIFPAAARPADVAAIQEALGELIAHRKAQAGDLYKEFSGSAGLRPDESEDDFITRHNASPGYVDPAVIPYYLLIVGDPRSIPFEFQYGLDVSYCVGRIYFENLEEYAAYARSVVESETTGQASLPRKAVFFGVANPDDPATNMSAEMLVKPLSDYVATKNKQSKWGWQTEVIASQDATHARLQSLLGGSETPALLFTASHGMGWPKGDPRQIPFQGALLCQDWPGPRQHVGEIPENFYFGGGHIPSDANPFGLVAFHFACYGAGTPYYDDYAVARSAKPKPIAARPFLADLPRRLLSHPRGGALAVIGHVERAWTYSFKWNQSTDHTKTFNYIFHGLMNGDPVGLALDPMNMRYADIATSLNDEIQEAGWKTPDRYKLAFLWTANNDSRGYAIIGDPAVRLPVVASGEAAPARPAIILASPPQGSLPEVLVEPQKSKPAKPKPAAGKPKPAATTPSKVTTVDASTGPAAAGYAAASYTVLDGLMAMSQRYAEVDAVSFGLKEDVGKVVQEVSQSLTNALKTLAQKLEGFVQNVTNLDVETFVTENMPSDIKGKTPRQVGEQRAWTHIELLGDVQALVPVKGGEVDKDLWALHVELVAQAQTNRAEMIKAAAEVLTGLIGPIGPK
jgi:hypothetical protein